MIFSTALHLSFLWQWLLYLHNFISCSLFFRFSSSSLNWIVHPIGVTMFLVITASLHFSWVQSLVFRVWRFPFSGIFSLGSSSLLFSSCLEAETETVNLSLLRFSSSSKYRTWCSTVFSPSSPAVFLSFFSVRHLPVSSRLQNREQKLLSSF